MKISRIRIAKTDLPYAGRAHVWGGKIASTTVADLAASKPANFPQNSTYLMNDKTRSTGGSGAWAEGGKLYAPNARGLGVVPDFDSLGAPIAEYPA